MFHAASSGISILNEKLSGHTPTHSHETARFYWGALAQMQRTGKSPLEQRPLVGRIGGQKGSGG